MCCKVFACGRNRFAFSASHVNQTTVPRLMCCCAKCISSTHAGDEQFSHADESLEALEPCTRTTVRTTLEQRPAVCRLAGKHCGHFKTRFFGRETSSHPLTQVLCVRSSLLVRTFLFSAQSGLQRCSVLSPCSAPKAAQAAARMFVRCVKTLAEGN